MRRTELMLVAVALCGCGGGARVEAPRRSEGRPAAVRVEEVKTASIAQDEVVAPGKVEIDPDRVTRVPLPLAGRVVTVEVKLGDQVARGQTLLRLQSAEAEEAASNCQGTEAALGKARAAVAKTRADKARAADLFEHGAVAQKELLNAEAEVTRAEGDVKEAEAAREQARRRVEILGLKGCAFGQQVSVAAPIAGRILDMQVVAGEYRNDTATPVLTLADLSTVCVMSEVQEDAIRLVHVGERVSIEMAAYPGELFPATVVRIADTVDPQTRTVRVHTQLANGGNRFRPEMFARIRHAHREETMVVVPVGAVVQGGGKAWVYVERAGGGYEKRAVETGEAREGMTPVRSGLKAGERVVVEGTMQVEGVVGGVR